MLALRNRVGPAWFVLQSLGVAQGNGKQSAEVRPSPYQKGHHGHGRAVHDPADLLIRQLLVFPQYDDLAELDRELLHRVAQLVRMYFANARRLWPCGSLERGMCRPISGFGGLDSCRLCCRLRQPPKPCVPQEVEQPAFDVTAHPRSLGPERDNIGILYQVRSFDRATGENDSVAVESIQMAS
jgi:hypothetical protein